MFVVDSSADEDDMDLAASELQGVLSHPSLKNLPVLILANKQDKQDARSADEVGSSGCVCACVMTASRLHIREWWEVI